MGSAVRPGAVELAELGGDRGGRLSATRSAQVAVGASWSSPATTTWRLDSSAR